MFLEEKGEGGVLQTAGCLVQTAFCLEQTAY